MNTTKSMIGLIAGCWLTGGAALAQPQPQNHAESSTSEVSVAYGFTAAGDTDFGGISQGEVDVQVARARVACKYRLTDEITMSVGAAYARFSIDASEGVPLPDTLEGASLVFGGTWTIDPAWSVIVTVEPGVYTDTEASSSDGFSVPGTLLARWQVSDTLTVAGGVRVQPLGDDVVLPVVSVQWQASPEWTLTLGAPRTEVAYQFDAATMLFAGASAEFGAFAVDDPAVTAPPGYPALRETELEYREIRVGLGVRRQIGPRVRAQIEGGMAVDRRFDYYDRGLKVEADSAAFASVSVVAEF